MDSEVTLPLIMPCPFCGLEAFLRDEVPGDTAESLKTFVTCAFCFCRGPEIYQWIIPHHDAREMRAIEAWNVRAVSPNQVTYLLRGLQK